MKLEILTQSCTAGTYGEYKKLKHPLYPVFVDRLPYRSWENSGGRDYFELTAAGGSAPYCWNITGGGLPTGMELDGRGKIFGTPTQEGVFCFRVTVTDADGENAEKELSWRANPFRGQWMEERKFGYMIQWGPYQEPAALTGEGIRRFETDGAGFSAEAWADELYRLGGRILNFTAMGGDDIRMWPSSFPSKQEYKTDRNFVKEMIGACRPCAARPEGLKVIMYLPGHSGWGGMEDTCFDGETGE